jgi:cyanophycinase
VVIIPAASGSPTRSGRGIAKDLVRHGLDPARVQLYPVAVRDDSSTPDEDESLWAELAWDEERVALLGEPAGFWFTGGDQTRIVDTLADEDGKPSPLLALIRARLAAGATIGGTSAGAAVMSNPMLAGGESFAALTEPVGSDYRSMNDQESGALLLTGGLGFLPGVLIDQHFDRKARLGRLVRAMVHTGVGQAYGIDEDTALIVALSSGQARVAGSGGVTLVFAADAANSGVGAKGTGMAGGTGVVARSLALGYAGREARFVLGQCQLSGPIGKATVGNEYFDYPSASGGGMAFGNQRLDQLLGYELLDNAGTRQVSRYSLHEDGRLLEYRFTQLPGSRGYWTDENGPSRYSACDVQLDVVIGRWRKE